MAPTTTPMTTLTTALQTTLTTLPTPTTTHLTARSTDNDSDPATAPRSDATMSDAARALKLRNLTIGWTLGIVALCILIGVTVFCVVGKRRCGLRRRERDFTGFDARVAGGGVPRAEQYDTRTEAEIRDERMWVERETRDREEEEAKGSVEMIVPVGDGPAARR